MLWVLYGVLHSVLRAAFAETGRVFRLDSWRLGFWQALWGVVVLLPLLPVMEWPEDGLFYLAAGGVALIFTVGMLMQMTLAADRNGRVFALYVPLEALAAAAIWVLVNPSMLNEYANDTLMTASVILAFLFSSLALLKIRDHDLNKKTLAAALPMGLTYAVAGVVTKIALSGYGIDTMAAALAYVLVALAVMAAVMGLAVLVKKKASGREMLEPRLIRGGAVAGLFMAMGYGTFAASVALAPNPGYVSMLAMLLPVWLLSWHGFSKMKDKARPLAALFIIISMLLLVVAAL